MKYLIVSDIHGDIAYINYLHQLVDIEQPDKIILLGDLMSLSDECSINVFIDKYRDKIVVIRGNCDFPTCFNIELLNFYREVINGNVFIFTHGHLFGYNQMDCDVFVYGHTHKNNLSEENGVILFNPGSLAQPRGGTVNSYGLITDDDLIIKDVDGNIIKKLSYKK